MENKIACVSVVIPLYNSSSTIENALNSVGQQSHAPLEIIVVDDGSTDDSAAKVEAFAATHPKLFINLIRKANGGVSTARNAGMKAAKGDYIALLDADDEWLPQKLSLQMEILAQHPEIDLLGANRNGETVKRSFFKKFDHLTLISANRLLYKWLFQPSTVIFKRYLLDRVGYFDEKQRYAEEGNYWLRIGKQHQCALLNESLVITGGGKPDFGFSGLSSNLKAMQQGEYKNLKDALQLSIIGHVQYGFLVLYSTLKYIRRILIVKLRK